MKMWVDYLNEEEGCETILTDYGFCSYTLNKNTGEFMCHHIYIVPEMRKKGKGVDFGVEIEKHAREIGAKIMTGNIWLNKVNGNRFIEKQRIFEAFGFEVVAVERNVVVMAKELEK